MAIFSARSQTRRFRPAARCLVGRAETCHVVLRGAEASREHAVIFHDGLCWQVRDLASQNGTYVRGERIRAPTQLCVGDLVGFGSEREAWVLLDAERPLARAVCQADGRVVCAGPRGLLLPDDERCAAYVSFQDGQWLLEGAGDLRRVLDGETLPIAGDEWTLELPLGESAAEPATTLVTGGEPRLLFRVSRDEEHVEMHVENGGKARSFAHRSHSYLLLLLARARLREQQLGATDSEQGWMETKELADMLKTSSEQINVWVWRAREQIQKFDPAMAQALVERRPSLGQLRLGIAMIATELL